MNVFSDCSHACMHLENIISLKIIIIIPLYQSYQQQTAFFLFVIGKVMYVCMSICTGMYVCCMYVCIIICMYMCMFASFVCIYTTQKYIMATIQALCLLVSELCMMPLSVF